MKEQLSKSKAERKEEQVNVMRVTLNEQMVADMVEGLDYTSEAYGEYHARCYRHGLEKELLAKYPNAIIVWDAINVDVVVTISPCDCEDDEDEIEAFEDEATEAEINEMLDSLWERGWCYDYSEEITTFLERATVYLDAEYDLWQVGEHDEEEIKQFEKVYRDCANYIGQELGIPIEVEETSYEYSNKTEEGITGEIDLWQRIHNCMPSMYEEHDDLQFDEKKADREVQEIKAEIEKRIAAYHSWDEEYAE